MAVKIRNKAKLLEWLGNPEKEFLNREQMSLQILGYARGETIYQSFTPDELSEIEAEALDMRRKKYSPHLSKADVGVLKQAAKGDSTAAKLAYQRFEGWSEKQQIEIGIPPELLEAIKLIFGEEYFMLVMSKVAELKGQGQKKIT